MNIMLIISQNASNYAIPFPDDVIYRINLAWVNSIQEFQDLLKKYKHTPTNTSSYGNAFGNLKFHSINSDNHIVNTKPFIYLKII